MLGALDARPASLAEAFHAVASSPGRPADDDNAKDVGGLSAGTVTVSSSRQSAHRVRGLARAEGILLWRNRLALLNAVILPPPWPAR